MKILRVFITELHGTNGDQYVTLASSLAVLLPGVADPGKTTFSRLRAPLKDGCPATLLKSTCHTSLKGTSSLWSILKLLSKRAANSGSRLAVRYFQKKTVFRGAINCVFAAASQATLWRREPLEHSSGRLEHAQESAQGSAQSFDQVAVTPTVPEEGPPAVSAVFCEKCGSENMINELLCHQCARPIDQDDAIAAKSASDISETVSRQYEIRWRRVLTGILTKVSSDSRRARKHFKHARDMGYESCVERFYKDRWYREAMIENEWNEETMRSFDRDGDPANRRSHVPLSRRTREQRGYAHWRGSWAEENKDWRRPAEYYDQQWAQWYNAWWG